MPLYRVFHETFDAEYSAQRPSSAANKGLTALRKRDPSLESIILYVQTSTKKRPTKFLVEYKEQEDPFLGLSKRPVATKLET